MKTNQLNNCKKSSAVGRSLRTLAVVALAFLPLVSVQAQNVYWALTNATASGNWSVGANWVGSAAPTTAKSAYFASTNIQSYNITNDVTANNTGTSNYIQDLVFDLASGSVANASETKNLNILPGTTLAVLGPNGFIITRDAPGVKDGNTHNILGNSLVVNNPSASFILNSGQGVGQNTAATINFASLTNLNVSVNVFGVANSILTGTGGGGIAAGDQVVKATLARTNVITALHTEAQYTVANFTNAVDLFRQDNTGISSSSDAQNSFFALGISNRIFADSVGIGRGTAIKGSSAIGFSALYPSTTAGSAAGYSMQFNKKDYSSSAYFRNNDGTSRMSLLDVTVNGGGTNTIVTGNRVGSFITFVGGTVDMLVDQIWLAKNYTNTFSTKLTDAGFGFDKGIVNANTVLVGDMQYTNASFCDGWLYVGSNAVMNVNSSITLGYTPTNDPTGLFLTSEIQTFGQVEVDGNGILYANTIQTGLVSTNNQIIVNGTLAVTNTIANPTNALAQLTVGGSGRLTFSVAAGLTNCYTTNLSVTAGGTINIASAPAGVGSYVLIHYLPGTPGGHSFNVGTLPAGILGASILDDGNGNVIAYLSPTPPKSLIWDGAQNSNWDHSSTNFFNPSGGTNCAFTDGDAVTFDDSNSIPTTISIVDTIYPSQIGNGVTMTNSANHYILANSGGSLLNASFVKAGTGSVELDCVTTLSVAVKAGSLTGSGSVGSISISTNASMNFAGTDNGALITSGNATLASGGTISGSASVQNGAVFVNAGTLNGALSMPAGSIVTNNNVMTAVGDATVSTNALLVNSGTIYGGNMTVNLGGTLIDTVNNVNYSTPGSINVSSLTISGTFKPGNGSIKTTSVTDLDKNNSPQAGTAGRVTLSPGSTTIMEVDMDNPSVQTNSFLLSRQMVFGPSFGYKSIGGGTLVITNIGTSTSFAAGQSFQMFGVYYDGTAPGNAGLNTTNTYPIIVPATPGPGLVWEMDQLFSQGIIRILSANDPLRTFSLTSSAAVVTGTNQIAVTLSWPTNNQGGWLQVLNSTLTNGLSATNWVNITGNYNANLNNMSLTNMWYITNTLVANPTNPGSATFYRFVYP